MRRVDAGTMDFDLSVKCSKSAIGINRALTREDLDKRATDSRRIEQPSLEDPEMRRRRKKHA
jgi:hypothetical protein